MKHQLDDGTPLLNFDNTPYDEDQRYGFFVGLAEHKKTQYKRDRSAAYPTIAEQLDMLWHDMNSDVISGKDGTWYNAILAVKNKHPKI